MNQVCEDGRKVRVRQKAAVIRSTGFRADVLVLQIGVGAQLPRCVDNLLGQLRAFRALPLRARFNRIEVLKCGDTLPNHRA